jgi:hypothetical protein
MFCFRKSAYIFSGIKTQTNPESGNLSLKVSAVGRCAFFCLFLLKNRFHGGRQYSTGGSVASLAA